jgi:NET1-associated nuclear protein 1 (U3 small nucleolar RNA-associated protein 17)
VLGDTRLPSRDDNLTNKGLDIADRSEKRTLFEDIFGSSAFANDNSESLQSTSTMSSHVRKPEGSRHELFDKPAYLMPALDNLFDPLVTSLLSSRIPEVDPKISEADEEDEDVTMIDETVQQPPFAVRPKRIPNQGEMELFTQLFRSTSITSTPILLPQYIYDCTKIFYHFSKPAGFFEGQW